jgi:2,5-diketo-D-gluconate reductase A
MRMQAHNYDNQKLIAQAIRDTGVPREDIFITSKVPGCISYNDTLAINDQSLAELNTS